MRKITNTKTVTEKTTVPQNASAAIYQQLLFYYFLFDIREGEEVGYECKDDIHVEYSKSKATSLIQVKHTILKNKYGEPKNLTEKDEALWHTVSNWINVISDPLEGRDSFDDQISFIESTSFEIYTNKLSENNPVFKKIDSFKSGDISIDDFKTYLLSLCTSEEDQEPSQTEKDILLLLSQESEWMQKFISKIKVVTISDIREKIISKIKHITRYAPLSGSTIENIYSIFHDKLTELIAKKSHDKKIIVSENKFRDIIVSCTSRFINPPKYEVMESDYHIPEDIVENLQNQVFIQQLIDIEDLDEGSDQILDYTSYKYAASVSMKRYFQDEAVPDDKFRFKKRLIEKWNNVWKKHYTSANKRKILSLDEDELEGEIISYGQALISDIRDKEVRVSYQQLTEDISNGHFYLLSDIPEIGWRLDWEEKYKDE